MWLPIRARIPLWTISKQCSRWNDSSIGLVSVSASSLNRPPTDVAAAPEEKDRLRFPLPSQRQHGSRSSQRGGERTTTKKRQKEYLKFSKQQLLITYCTGVREREEARQLYCRHSCPKSVRAGAEAQGDLPKMQNVICNCRQKGAAIIQCSL